MRLIYGLLALVMINSICFAQIPDEIRDFSQPLEFKISKPHHFEFDKYKRKIANSTLESKIQREKYDVLNYDIFMDWTNPLSNNPKNFNYTGKVTLTLKIDSANTDIIKLNSIDNEEFVVKVDNQIASFVYDTSNGLLNINLGKTAQTNDVLNIEVSYTHIFKQYRGFFPYKKGMFVGFGPIGDSVFVEENIAYTMAEPEDARYWMPCNDAPYDKASVKFTIKVPEGFEVAANGLLKEVIKNPGEPTTFIWEDNDIMATYLMAVTASKYKTLSHWYKKVSNPSDSIEIKYYAWPGDYQDSVNDGSKYNAEFSFRNTLDMMKIYSTIYGEYPFSKYGMVSVQPFGFGGMEHQTMTTITRAWLRGWSDFGIAHELAHQWLGDLVTCATWDDIWLNEGGATWSEAIYYEALNNNKDNYYYYMRQNLVDYFKRVKIFTTPIYGIETNSIFSGSYPLLVYNKASWVYHMLREMMGDEEYFKTLRNYFTKFAHQSIETKDYIEFFKTEFQNPPISLDTYFDQWIFKAGHPKYSTVTNATTVGDKIDAEVTVVQNQSGENVPNVFVMPIELLFYQNNKVMFSKVFVNDNREQTFKVTLDFIPDSVIVNNNKVICQNISSEVILSVDDENNELSIYPNPIQGDGSVFIKLNGINTTLNIQIFDELGNLIKDLGLVEINDSNSLLKIDTENLSSSNYYVRISSNSYSKVLPFVVVK